MIRILLFCLLLAGLVIRPAVADLPALRALQGQGYAVAAYVVDLESGRVVAAIDPDKQMTPASVTKLYTAALALETWGTDYRFETEVLTRGTRSGARLDGDLILKGGGDPKLTNEHLWRLAHDVARSGITEVTGNLIVDESRFGTIACDNKDRCQSQQRTWRSFDALLSATPVNHGIISVSITPGARVGDPARVRIEPFDLPSYTVNGRVNTVDGFGNQAQVSRYTDANGERLEVSGSIGVNAGTHHVYRSVGQPARYAGELFQAFLKSLGVNVNGRVAVTTEPVNSRRLTRMPGQPMTAVLNDMQYYSNNLIADVMALNLLVERNPGASVSMGAAGGVLQLYAHELTAQSRFAQGPSNARLFDGSGLNPDNRLSPVDLVALLDHVYQRSQDFPFFVGALRVPYHSPARGLSGSEEVWRRMSLKTGGLSEPVSVHTQAGYLRFPDGGWGAYAMLVNGRPGNSIYRVKAFEAMRRDLERLQR